MADPVTRVEATLLELEQQHPDARELVAKLRRRLQPMLHDLRAPGVNRSLDEWSSAFREAARTDLATIKVLVDSDGDHAPTIAMLLQMTFEKVAKAYLAETDGSAFIKHRRSHVAARKLVRIIKNDKERRLLPQVGSKPKQVLLWVEALTDAHPALTKHGPHLEYPWETHDRVCTPGKDLLIVNVLRDPKSGAVLHLTRFASQLIDRSFK